MATEFNWLEMVDSTSPNSAGFSLDGGKATMTYLLEDVTADDLQDAIIELLGATEIDPSDGKLMRTPPLAHPVFSWLFASSITNIRGVGEFDVEDAEEELEVPPIEEYALYDSYFFTVEFTPRPYGIATDDKISLVGGTYTDEDGEEVVYTYATEWERYCDFDLEAQFQAVTAQLGQYKFNATGPASGRLFTGGPRLFLPNQLLKFRWMAVPYRYISSPNSYIASDRVGKINQFEWNGYMPGELLYLGYTIKRFSPPVQDTELFEPGIFSTEKLCDLEFKFLFTKRTIGAPPSTPPTNANFIAAGHNLLPWINRKFYYAQTVAIVTPPTQPSVPPFFSFPLEILFMDPDV